MEHPSQFTQALSFDEQDVQHVQSPALVLVTYFTTTVHKVGSFYHWG
jgi:hypothetical protein